ncbi:MAG: glutamine-hydrolyzing GMP synthase [Verrucomicrobiales bacterium]|nr:glutamine-hydrolyzing GMP synthase [Verrucomicrobiales bacterium]
MDANHIAVIDFGSQYTQLIVRRVRELGYFSRLYQPGDLRQTGKPAAVILSGGPRSVTEAGAPDIDLAFLKSLEVPVLGVCYGMQLLAKKGGGTVAASHSREYGPAQLCVAGDSPLFRGLSPRSQIWMSHSDTVEQLPAAARIIGENQDGVPVALQFAADWFGIQFHPEVSHSHEGAAILGNFLKLAHGAERFEIDSFKNLLIRQIRDFVGEREVVCGVSGGVDSTVLAVLLKESGIRHRAIFVDTGLLRKNEALEVQEQFRELGVQLETINASQRFLEALRGQTDPEKKRSIIGNLFIDVFWESAANVEILAQGTLYPDVIESATSGSIASKIKTHHNRVDRIMELKRDGRVLEPLHELFKDEVRAVGRSLLIPDRILNRHPFPGPGLAVRCPGEVTEDKLAIIREGDAIFMHLLRESGWYDKVWQAYCALVPVKTVGVKGDERSYEYAVSLRAVTSEDAMTADWAKLPYELLGRISNEILNKVRGINRVLYDISTKPPASIEWE